MKVVPSFFIKNGAKFSMFIDFTWSYFFRTLFLLVVSTQSNLLKTVNGSITLP